MKKIFGANWLIVLVIAIMLGIVLTAASAFTVHQHGLTREEFCAANWHRECPSQYPSGIVNAYGWPLPLSARVEYSGNSDSMGGFLKSYSNPQLTSIDEAEFQDLFITHGRNLLIDLFAWTSLIVLAIWVRNVGNARTHVRDNGHVK